MKIGITGSICSGKSSVIRFLGQILSVDVLDSDQICRELLQINQEGWMGVTKNWGDTFLTKNKEVDRIKLRQAIFKDPLIREQLENILHPLVRQRIKMRAEKKFRSDENLLIEIPLLFEVGWQDDFDWTILAYATNETCLERIIVRDRVSAKEAVKALNAQMDIWDKVQLSDSVIDNSGSWVQTVLQMCYLKRIFSKFG